jgi:Zn-dependent peptidase ImmA (M78 family)/transcriptional regulator with XRE-family HTH domain
MQVNPDFIILAREARNHTQKEFANLLDVEQGTLSKIENGILPVSGILFEKICTVLNFPPEFFIQTKQPDRIQGHYRKKVSVAVKELKRAQALMTIMEMAIIKLLDSVDIPPPNIPKWDVTIDGSPTQAAQFARNFWKITTGRIDELSKLLEDNGIIIIPLDLGEMDGLSTYINRQIPVIFVNKTRPGDRQRFTIVHEFAHLVMHFEQKLALDRDVEAEAHEFASEFLLPEKEIAPLIPSRLTMHTLVNLKTQWSVSMQAILMKAHKINKITYNQYTYMMRAISALGLRKNEYVTIPQEKPLLFKEIIQTFIEDLDYTIPDLSKLLYMSKEDIQSLFIEQGAKLKIIRNVHAHKGD